MTYSMTRISAIPGWAQREGMVAFAGYPMLLEGGVLGVMAMFARQPLSKEAFNELAPIADGIAQWVRRKRAEEALRESEGRLRSFAGELERLVAERTDELVQSQARLRELATELNLTEHRERTKLAAELHDHLAQLLVLGRLKLGQAKRLGGLAGPCADLVKDAEGVLHEALAYTRTLVAGLSPPVLHEFGLAAALRWLATQMERYHLTVEVEAPEVSAWPIPEDRAVLLFQSVRELLINTAKHAGVDRATVRLACPAAGVELEVRDEGRGFDLTAVEQGASGASQFGLFSIRERMKALGASSRWRRRRGRGRRRGCGCRCRGGPRRRCSRRRTLRRRGPKRCGCRQSRGGRRRGRGRSGCCWWTITRCCGRGGGAS